MDQLHEKYENLKVYLKSLGSVAVAFSSGVDSTFLLKVAHDVLGDKAIAVTAASCSFPERELNEAKKFCAENGIKHIVCESEELDIDGFRQNPKNRCYLCKHELFEKVWNIAKESGLMRWQKVPIWMIMEITDRVLWLSKSWGSAVPFVQQN